MEVKEKKQFKRMPRVEVTVKCHCGRSAEMVADNGPYMMYRIRCDDLCCWQGPLRKTENEAIDSWFELMAFSKIGNDLIKDIGKEKLRLNDVMEEIRAAQAEGS